MSHFKKNTLTYVSVSYWSSFVVVKINVIICKTAFRSYFGYKKE